MNLGYKDNSSLKKINYIEAYLCFLTFGILVGISKEEFNFVSLLSSMVFSLLFGYLFIKLMIYIFLKVNRDIFFDDTTRYHNSLLVQCMSVLCKPRSSCKKEEN